MSREGEVMKLVRTDHSEEVSEMEAAHISPELPIRWVVSADRTVEIKEEVTELGCDQANERILQEETPPSSITERGWTLRSWSDLYVSSMHQDICETCFMSTLQFILSAPPTLVILDHLKLSFGPREIAFYSAAPCLWNALPCFKRLGDW
ncbi:uncharacterized protein LOC131696667 isoform X2 [Acipenser ruthenus]|uniref:uncharacterized protein LOC131696667 isoform X2 n=1 Tax=Acipenser ruthenus TaxID=7906 RepID=UPI002741C235|nr:uncharacterized protein LOC131696667 isoform X2 [Acipenser ruthenus]